MDTTIPSVPQPLTQPETPVSSSPQKPKKSKALMIIIIVLFACIVTAAGVIAYTGLLVDPLQTIEKSFSKFSDVDSFVADFSSAEGEVTSVVTLHKEENSFSQIDVDVPDIGEGESLKASLIVSSENLYLMVFYSGMQELIDQLVAVYPPLVETETYQLTLPALLGRTWLHIAIPEPDAMVEEGSEGPEPTVTISDEELKELQDIFINSIIVKEHDRRFVTGGTTYTRIVLGFKKEELVRLLNKLKDINVDIKVSEINAMIDVVEAVPNWDDELVEILIDREGFLNSLTMSLPDIPEEAISQGIEENLDEESAVEGIIGQYSGTITEFLGEKKSAGSLTKVGTITFKEYDNAPIVLPPKEAVEFDEVLAKAEVELMPIIGAMLMQTAPPDMQTEMMNPYDTTLGVATTSADLPEWLKALLGNKAENDVSD